MKALQHLCLLADQHKAERHRNTPAFYFSRSKYTDHDSKSLTLCIVDWFILNNLFVTQITSTGSYRTGIQLFVVSAQRIRLPELFAVVEGRAIFIEVKQGKEPLPHVQMKTMTSLERAGAYVYIAHTFQGFYNWFNREFLNHSFNYGNTK